MEKKDINLKDKNEEEIFKSYLDIASEIEVQKMIWDEVKDLKLASETYEKYLERKSTKDE